MNSAGFLFSSSYPENEEKKPGRKAVTDYRVFQTTRQSRSGKVVKEDLKNNFFTTNALPFKIHGLMQSLIACRRAGMGVKNTDCTLKSVIFAPPNGLFYKILSQLNTLAAATCYI
ncbi:MAG: hypothetical protein B6D37_02535 [Sphingobacteriales bacterium UTBCD1]|jgi:hypothetical protein|nr:MAG: hypothetical protein B6D37_02535 [Sphingobacteriales bacterium UTBCD1]